MYLPIHQAIPITIHLSIYLSVHVSIPNKGAGLTAHLRFIQPLVEPLLMWIMCIMTTRMSMGLLLMPRLCLQ